MGTGGPWERGGFGAESLRRRGRLEASELTLSFSGWVLDIGPSDLPSQGLEGKGDYILRDASPFLRPLALSMDNKDDFFNLCLES